MAIRCLIENCMPSLQSPTEGESPVLSARRWGTRWARKTGCGRSLDSRLACLPAHRYEWSMSGELEFKGSASPFALITDRSGNTPQTRPVA